MNFWLLQIALDDYKALLMNFFEGKAYHDFKEPYADLNVINTIDTPEKRELEKMKVFDKIQWAFVLQGSANTGYVVTNVFVA